MTPPLLIFQFGEALAEFRFRIEIVYSSPAGLLAGYGENPLEVPLESIPASVDATLDTVSRLADMAWRIAGGRPGLDRAAASVRRAARNVRNTLVRTWYSENRLARIRARRKREFEPCDVPIDARLTVQMLSGSPVGPDRWADFELAVRTFECGLPGSYQPLFALGRLLARIDRPQFEDHVGNAERGNRNTFDHALTAAVRAAATWAAADISGLADLPIQSDDMIFNNSFKIRDRVVQVLERTPDVRIAAVSCPTVDAAEYKRLEAIKTSLTGVKPRDELTTDFPPNREHFFGVSLPILRVFEKIHICQVENSRSVLLLGPKGTGKTTLAELIHRALIGETHKGRRFFRWQAAHSQGSDPNLALSRWVGVGKNSGLQNMPKEGKKGLLEECEGGSIFVDEFADLSHDLQLLLLDVTEGKPQTPLGGSVMEVFKPDVRLILATNKDVSTHIREDLLDRIPVKLWIPPLRDRPEDLFPIARQFLRPNFTLTLRTWSLLLAHDWPGNVRELQQAIRRVIAAHQANGNSSSMSRKKGLVELPHGLFLSEVKALRETARRVGEPADETAAEYRLFKRITALFEDRGYRESARERSAGPLYRTVGDFLGMTKSNVSRWKKKMERCGASMGT
jgi:transcriptional regulator with AAA-type ATPase domain